MQPEVAAASASPRAPLKNASAAGRMRLSMQAGPLLLMPRVLDPAMANAIEALEPAALPSFDVSGSAARVRQEIKAVFARYDGAASPLWPWLRQDLLDLASLFAAAAGVDRLRAKLQVVEDDMCRKFHTDNVAFRLVTTYRGPGTEWLPPHAVDKAPVGAPLLPKAIRRLERGTIAVMRGGRAATPTRPAVLHRSPPIAGSGQVRLFLAINDLDGVVAVDGT